MKHTIFSTLLALTVVLGFGAQRSQAQGPKELVWEPKRFAFEEFALESPFGFEPDLYKQTDDERMYSGKSNDVYLYAFSDSIKEKAQFRKVKDFVKGSGSSKLEMPSTENEFVRIDFLDKFGYYNKIWTLTTKSRLYTFQTVSKSEENEIATRFLSSIKLVEPNSDVPVISDVDRKRYEDEFEQAASNVPPYNPVRGSLDSGTGIGTGNKPTSAPTSKTTSLKLISKPKALYTDLARFYEISGPVRLRITFMADGTVGAITPVNTLPFGLTEGAVDAAKKIVFEPGTVNGVPVNITKLFEYTFTIY